MSVHDSLGDRMKRQYEDRTRVLLPRRTYTILRADGKAFHTYTRHCEKPFDVKLAAAMTAAAVALCEEVQGAIMGFVQSDEISVVSQDFADIRTEAWFDGNLQKMVSVGASIVTNAFNQADGQMGAIFDCRAFTIPDPIEVENYFVWRQQDATRNSIQALAQHHFSHKQLQGLNVNELQEKLFQERGINWDNLPPDQKRGRAIIRRASEDLESGWFVDVAPPVFTKGRAYLSERIRKHHPAYVLTPEFAEKFSQAFDLPKEQS